MWAKIKLMFGNGWTTLFGLIGGLFTGYGQYLAAGNELSFETFLAFLSVFLIGLVSKDADKTGAAQKIE